MQVDFGDLVLPDLLNLEKRPMAASECLSEVRYAVL